MFKTLLLTAGLLPLFATAYTGQSYVVYDFSQNRVLESHQANQIKPIASVTKLMTANIFLEHNTDKHCTAAITAADTDFIKGTYTHLPKNKPIACQELLKAMLVQSDNYAAHALSRAAGMSRAQFIQKMNQKAKQLGMHSTHFKDSSGLSSENVSSVADLVKLSRYSLQKQAIRELSNTRATLVKAGNRHIYMHNTNALVRNEIFDAALNKTGYTKEAGYNLVFINKHRCRNGLIGVISLNNQSAGFRSNFTKQKLMQYGCTTIG